MLAPGNKYCSIRSNTFLRVVALHASRTVLSVATVDISVVVPINDGVSEYSSCLDSASGQPTALHRVHKHPCPDVGYLRAPVLAGSTVPLAHEGSTHT